MRMRRANDHGKGLAGKREVIAEVTRSRKQAMVFTPPRRAADTRFLHGDAPRPKAGPTLIMICPRQNGWATASRLLIRSPKSPCAPGIREKHPWLGHCASLVWCSGA